MTANDLRSAAQPTVALLDSDALAARLGVTERFVRRLVEERRIRDVVTERAPDATICIDTFHVIGWATTALDEVRRLEWNKLRQAGAARSAKEFKGWRFLLRRNREHLTMGQREVIWALEAANRRTFRAFQLKEELRDIFALPLLRARRALDDWLAYASRSRLPPFVKLARTIRRYRASIEATIEWGFTNGIAESNNASIGRLRTNAPGFHNPKAFITMIMLDCAGITPTSHGSPTPDPRDRQLSAFSRSSSAPRAVSQLARSTTEGLAVAGRCWGFLVIDCSCSSADRVSDRTNQSVDCHRGDVLVARTARLPPARAARPDAETARAPEAPGGSTHSSLPSGSASTTPRRVALADVDAPCAERLQPGNLGVLVEVGRREVEVQAAVPDPVLRVDVVHAQQQITGALAAPAMATPPSSRSVSW